MMSEVRTGCDALGSREVSFFFFLVGFYLIFDISLLACTQGATRTFSLIQQQAESLLAWLILLWPDPAAGKMYGEMKKCLHVTADSSAKPRCKAVVAGSAVGMVVRVRGKRPYTDVYTH